MTHTELARHKQATLESRIVALIDRVREHAGPQEIASRQVVIVDDYRALLAVAEILPRVTTMLNATRFIINDAKSRGYIDEIVTEARAALARLEA